MTNFLSTLFKKNFCLTVILSVLCDLLNHVSTMKFIYLPSVWLFLHNDFVFQIWLKNINISHTQKKIMVFFVNAGILFFIFIIHLKNNSIIEAIWWCPLPCARKKTNLHTKEKVILVRNRRKTPLLLIKKQQAGLGSTFPLMMETGCCRSNYRDSCLRRSDGTSDLLHNHM